MLKLTDGNLLTKSKLLNTSFKASDSQSDYMQALLSTINKEIQARGETRITVKPNYPIVNYKIDRRSGSSNIELQRSSDEILTANFDDKGKLTQALINNNEINPTATQKEGLIKYLEIIYRGLANNQFDQGYTTKIGSQEYPIKDADSLDSLFSAQSSSSYPSIDVLREKHNVSFLGYSKRTK